MKIIPFFLLVLLFSCTQKRDMQLSNLKIELGSVLESPTTDKLFADVRYTKLESQADILLGDDLYFETREDKLYILDRRHQKSLLVFSNNGKFLSKVGKVGNGPEEYTNAIDFIIRNDTVDILSSRGDDVTIYSYLLKGKFITKKELKHQAYSFQLIDDKYYAVSTNYNKMLYDHQVYLLDKNGNEVKKLLPNNTEINMPIGENCFSIFKNQVYYFEAFNNKVYFFENEELKPIYELDFGKYNIPKEFFHTDLMKGFETINKQGFSLIKNVFVNTDHIIFEVTKQKEGEPGSLYVITYNKKTEEIQSITLDEDNYIFRYPIGLNDKNEMMYLVFPMGDINADFERFGLKPNISDFNESDNPIVVYCKL